LILKRRHGDGLSVPEGSLAENKTGGQHPLGLSTIYIITECYDKAPAER